MRTAEGKDYCLYLDHAGNVEGWYDDVMDFWANGVDSLDVAEKRKPKRREGEDRPDVVCDCGFVLQTGMQSCPVLWRWCVADAEREQRWCLAAWRDGLQPNPPSG